MLERICIQNFALIDSLELTLLPGLNVLTGETGAGKSILIDAVNLVLGGRADRELVRTGAQEACVSAQFRLKPAPRALEYLREKGYEQRADEPLILQRFVQASGRSACRVNGRSESLAFVRELSALLMDIHGQHEHQSLLNSALHIEYLDRFDFESAQLRAQVAGAYARVRGIRRQLDQTQQDEHERARRMDMLRFQIAEITAANLAVDEEQSLRAQRALMRNAERISTAFGGAYARIYDRSGFGDDSPSALDLIEQALAELEGIADLDESFAALAARTAEVRYALEDVAAELRDKRDSFAFEPAELAQVEDRLEVIQALKRKYGADIPAILAFCDNAQRELDGIVNHEQRREDLEEQLRRAMRELYGLSMRLSSSRRSAAARLESMILTHLYELGMERTRFVADFSPIPESFEDCRIEDFSRRGLDEVEFLISPNPGEPLKPLARIISGGELSRVMLSLKCGFADIDDIPSLVFDEIDAGIGGRVAQAVGRKMAQVAKNHQVLCVTHLAQIAAQADAHYLVSKSESDERTATDVVRLPMNRRERELARMMDGENITELALEHAREMIRAARRLEG